jgi:ribosomal protein S18 acetylase RimI-like enzyme
MTADYERAITEHIIYLWEEKWQLIGLIEIIPNADHFVIENIAVRPDQQGRGIGDALLRHAEQAGVSMGFNAIHLYTNAAFASNLAFYIRRGYQEYDRRSFALGGITVFMRKRIDGDAA